MKGAWPGSVRGVASTASRGFAKHALFVEGVAALYHDVPRVV
jgi:hypothetical protein